jgi:3-phenylpropionate/trans-cinnamate dioxygenase ferredoxin subunit
MVGIQIARVSDIPREGDVRRFELDGRWIAIANLGDDGFRAVDAVCSHQHAWLDEGEVDVADETIECPLHGSSFDLNTGAPTCFPATQPIAVYPVTIDGDAILIEVN